MENCLGLRPRWDALPAVLRHRPLGVKCHGLYPHPGRGALAAEHFNGGDKTPLAELGDQADGQELNLPGNAAAAAKLQMPALTFQPCARAWLSGRKIVRPRFIQLNRNHVSDALAGMPEDTRNGAYASDISPRFVPY